MAINCIPFQVDDTVKLNVTNYCYIFLNGTGQNEEPFSIYMQENSHSCFAKMTIGHHVKKDLDNKLIKLVVHMKMESNIQAKINPSKVVRTSAI